MGDKFNYTNVEYTGNDDYSNFPVIVLKGEEDVISYSIIHRFKTSEGLEYAVIGKIFAESLIESIKDYKEFITLLSKIFVTTDKKSRIELLNELKISKFFRHILFTQEGYDLVTGKYLFTNGEVQRTILPGTYVEDDELIFDSTYVESKDNKVSQLKNESGVTTEIRTFDSFDKYENNYFVNKKDFMKMEPKEAASYVSEHYNKIINYIKNNYPSFYKNASDISSFETPEEKIAYMTQLLDVLYDAQFGEKYSRQI